METRAGRRVRGLADPVGFAHRAAQIEEVLRRIGEGEAGRRLESLLRASGVPADLAWRAVVAPHDDYAYASYMYPLALSNVRARTVVVFGVAHKARSLGLEDRIVFDTFTHWHGPYGDIPVSPLREALLRDLDPALYGVHDEMQSIEHCVEAKLPFLQSRRRDLEVLPILVPAMAFARMREIAPPLARALAAATRGLEWGPDFALVLSTDAVHYGDRDWGGRDFARYGADEAGYRKAVAFEHALLQECFTGELLAERAELFSRHTVRDDDWREYRWTWCGRYSVPFGLLAAWHLQQALGAPPLEGRVLGYATSIDTPRIAVDDLDGMGVTAPASLRHWVGYAAVGYS